MNARPDVWMLDPDGFTPDYNNGLSGNLGRLGWNVHCVGFSPSDPDIPAPGSVQAEPAFHSILKNASRTGALSAFHSALLRRSAKAALYPYELAIFLRQLFREKPGILHVQWAPAPPLDVWSWKLLKRRGWSIVFTAHDPTYLPGSPHQLFGNWVRTLCASADGVVVHSMNALQSLRNLQVRSKTLRVIPPGANPVHPNVDRAQARTTLNLPDDVDMILFFGFVKRYKGLHILLQALPQILNERKNVVLVIAGEWQDRKSYYGDLIKRNGLRNRVILREEYIPESQVAQYFTAANVIALPYTEASSSGVLLKAYVLGCPVVATRVGGFPELVEDGRSGILVEPNDAQALASGIVTVLENNTAAMEMTKRAKILLDRTFSWPKAAVQTAALYSDVWNGNSLR